MWLLMTLSDTVPCVYFAYKVTKQIKIRRHQNLTNTYPLQPKADGYVQANILIIQKYKTQI